MDLSTALSIRAGDVIALTGGGGKTAALYLLGEELATRSLPVLLCGTTRFTPPEGGAAPKLVLVESEIMLHRAVEQAAHWPVTAATGWGSKGRLLPLPSEWVDALHSTHPELTIVIEADGSAMRPFKAPGPHEPVIPTSASLVVSVVGMDAAEGPLDERHVHRPERVSALIGVAIGDPVTPALIARVLAHVDGGRKHVPAGARWLVLLNKADTPARRAAAAEVAAHLPRGATVVIAQLKRLPPVLAVLETGRPT